MNIEFTIDVSINNTGHTEESIQRLKDLGLVGAIFRLGDGYRIDKSSGYWADLFRKLDIPFGGYWVPYASDDMNKTLDLFNQEKEKYPDLKSTFDDVEWYRYADGSVVPAHICERDYWDFHVRSKTDAMYTGMWCVDKYFPKIGELLYEEGLKQGKVGWYAHYAPYFSGFRTYVESLGGSLDPKVTNKLISISHLPKILEIISTYEMKPPYEGLGWGMWQCVTYLPFKEFTYSQRHLDFNLITEEAYKEWFTSEPEEPEYDPELQERLMRSRIKHDKRNLRNRIKELLK